MTDAARRRARQILDLHAECADVFVCHIDAMIQYGQEREQSAFAAAAKVCDEQIARYKGSEQSASACRGAIRYVKQFIDLLAKKKK